MSTLVMVRTECCESYKHCGMRCSNCPCRPNNREAALNFQQQANAMSFGRRRGTSSHTPVNESSPTSSVR